MIFDTKVAGIPCQCRVTHFYPPQPMRVHKTNWGFAEPATPAEFEYVLLDRKGYPAPWLEKKLNQQAREALKEEIYYACMAEKYGYEF